MTTKLPERVEAQRKEVTEKLIADMQKYGGKWVKEWSGYGNMPKNGVSNAYYRGGNLLHLMAMSMKRNYKGNRWYTFNQAKKLGYKLKKGSKSCIVEKWKTVTFAKQKVDDDGEPIEGEYIKRSYLKCVGYWSVFNEDCFEGVPEQLDVDTYTRSELDDIADRFIASSRCRIYEQVSDRAFYAPMSDTITLPMREQFSTVEGFLSTLWHEMGHSTMCDTPAERPQELSDDGYAFEELIAELTSVFVGNEINVAAIDTDSDHYKNHLAYLKSWLKHLKDDTSFLFKAASKASLACQYMVEQYENTPAQVKAA